MRTLIDCDGVMAQWTKMFIEVCRTEFDIDPGVCDGKSWDFFNYPGVVEKKDEIWNHILHTPGLIRNLDKYDYTDELVAKLRERGEVVCVTSIVAGGVYADERIVWLIEEMGFHHTDIILAYKKFLVEGDVFIDDKPENVILWANRWHEVGGVPVLWQPPEKQMVVEDPRLVHTGSVDELMRELDERGYND